MVRTFKTINGLKLTEYRKELRKEKKNICFGELCDPEHGIIQLLNNFSRKCNMCKKCNDLRLNRIKLKQENKNICYGSLCNGKIQNISEFKKGSNVCRICLNKKTTNKYKINGYPIMNLIIKLKLGKSCAHCGETDIRLLEFDHCKGTKSFTISCSDNKEKILKEIEKTQFLCVWCHRIKTYNEIDRIESHNVKEHYSHTEEQKLIITKGKKCNGLLCQGEYRDVSLFGRRGEKMLFHRCKNCVNYESKLRYIENKNYIITRKLEIGSCQNPECDKKVDNTNYMCFDFDHLRDKLIRVSQLVTSTINIQKIDEEIAKCQLLCCNCHKIKTCEQLNYSYNKFDLESIEDDNFYLEKLFTD